MKYLPFENFKIHTILDSNEIFYRFRASVDTKGTWQILINKPYFGQVGRADFQILRVTWWYRNFSPVISGEIHPEDPGSSVRIKMRLPWFSFLFFGVWLGDVWYMFFSGITNLVIKSIQTGNWQTASPLWVLPIIALFAFGYLMVIGGFRSETKRSKAFLVKLLDAQSEDIEYNDKVLGLTEFQIINLLLLITVTISILSIIRSIFQ